MYVDAVAWVKLPNVAGMALFARHPLTRLMVKHVAKLSAAEKNEIITAARLRLQHIAQL